jgi:hypothetical protein
MICVEILEETRKRLLLMTSCTSFCKLPILNIFLYLSGEKLFFVYVNLKFRGKPKFTLSYPPSKRTLVSQPDYAIFRTTSSEMSFIVPEIVAVGMEVMIL